LPEAQLDRFLLHVVLDYPSADDELVILQKDRAQHYGEDRETMSSPLHPETVLTARREVAEIHVEEMLEKYIVSLVGATRNLSDLNPDWHDFLIAGASPRASIALLRAASATAYLRGRDHVIPEDIIEIAPDVIRHRLILGYAARAANVSRDDIIKYIIEQTPIP
ncbi:MAG: MoxR family ATPase, partial [Gammaproteobacteria bacterium]|nr:MoxR family ATPase [Gammaproteobacteria bacterium]